MRAAVLTQRGRIEIDREYREPALNPGDVRLRVQFSGICGSDLHEFVSGPFLIPMPVVLGHEFCGEVVEVAPEVRDFKRGDRAVGMIYPSCGVCDSCRHGDFTLCENLLASVTEHNGSFAEYVSVPARQLFLVPPGTPSDEAALIEPSSVACHAIRRSRLELGENVVVIGAGPIGLLTVGMARAAGARRIAVVEPASQRCDLALRMGADLALDPAAEVDPQVMELTAGRGAEVVFETSGVAPGFETALRLTRKQGRLVMVALYEGKQPQLDANGAVLKEVDMIASFWANDVDFRRAVHLISSRALDVRPLISGSYGLNEIQTAFEALQSDRGRYGKLLVNCG